ncbi:hypothetical protein WH47_07014, partial [Habropoda laboriosa]
SPTIFYMLRALQHFLADNKFNNIDSIGNNIEKYFNGKPKEMYSDGINSFTKTLGRSCETRG